MNLNLILVIAGALAVTFFAVFKMPGSMKAKIPVAVIMLGAAWYFGSKWSIMHPWMFHDCRLMQEQCPSHYATWILDGPNHPTYGQCGCSAALHVGGHG